MKVVESIGIVGFYGPCNFDPNEHLEHVTELHR